MAAIGKVIKEHETQQVEEDEDAGCRRARFIRNRDAKWIICFCTGITKTFLKSRRQKLATTKNNNKIKSC